MDRSQTRLTAVVSLRALPSWLSPPSAERLKDRRTQITPAIEGGSRAFEQSAA
jgi:hypothetical protein